LVAKVLKIKVHEIQFISENIKKRDVVFHKNLGHPRFETHLVISTTPHHNTSTNFDLNCENIK